MVWKTILNSNIRNVKQWLIIGRSRKKILAFVFYISGMLLLLSPFIVTYIQKIISEKKIQETQITHTSQNLSTFGAIRIDQSLISHTKPAEIPLRIVIPAVNIDIPITEAEIVNGVWEVSETMASHGAGSAYPGQQGNTVIFAHARDKLFLPLKEAKVKQIAYVLTNTSWHRYEIQTIHEVSPDDIEVIAPTEDETLTLFTCSGFLDNKRMIVTAKPLYP